MALDPILWALKDAPVADALERLVLTILAEYADEDGCGALPSQGTIAKRALVSRDAVKDRIDSLSERGLIVLGDQARAASISPEFRPVVWDVAIPLARWRSPERIQDFRASRGLPPLTVEERPEIPSPPLRKRRSDAGRKRLKVVATAADLGDESPLGDTSTQGDVRPQGDTSPVGDVSGQGGGYKPEGVGDTSPPTLPSNNPPNDPPNGVVADTDQLPFSAPDGAGGDPRSHRKTLDDHFSEFYDGAYPRRVGRREARKAWDAARKREPIEKILAGAERLRDDPNRPGYPQSLIPHPATWLNRDGWHDEPLAPRQERVDPRPGPVNPDGSINVDSILGRDLWQLPAPPDGIRAGEVGFAAWARSERDKHLAERQQQARTKIAEREAIQ